MLDIGTHYAIFALHKRARSIYEEREPNDCCFYDLRFLMFISYCHLQRGGPGTHLKDLCILLAIKSRDNMAKRLSKLRKAGLIDFQYVKSPDTDQRVAHWHLTDNGKESANFFIKSFAQAHNEYLHDLKHFKHHLTRAEAYTLHKKKVKAQQSE